MAKTVAEVFWDVLAAHGVTHVFGIPGDSIDLLLQPLEHDRRIQFVQVRHEEAGAFMASAYAKKTGRLGVCMGTAGPGAIHLLNGLYDAKLDHAPVLAITGQVGLPYLGTDFFQEIDTLGLYQPVALYSQQIVDPNQIAVLADLACRQALVKRGVAHLSFPFEVPRMKVHAALERYSVPDHRLDSMPVPDMLDEAAARLDQSERPVILAGKGALSARLELAALADRAQIPVINTLPAKGVLPDDHPLTLGGLGLLGAKPAHQAMESCDLCLMVGTNYPYLEFLPDKATIMQIDWEASQIGKRHLVDLGLVGSARPTLAALTERVRVRSDSPWAQRLAAERRHWLKQLTDEAHRDTQADGPVNPKLVADVLSRSAAHDANIAVDVGNALVWMSRGFRVRQHGWLVSAWLGSMAFGIPAAIAAKIAEPERQSIAVVGDGALGMMPGDFVTALKYHWPITVVVLNNHKLGMIKFEQEVHGMPEFGTALYNPDFAAYARACGGEGYRVERPSDLKEAIEAALAASTSSIVDVLVDPNVRPMPPRITFDQARGYAEALFRETLHV